MMHHLKQLVLTTPRATTGWMLAKGSLGAVETGIRSVDQPITDIDRQLLLLGSASGRALAKDVYTINMLSDEDSLAIGFINNLNSWG
ncbi:MAG: hypothetical protein JNN15_17135 [Blastocatellia bacterium]|nr:hypothetical protein [Blastocatellia bacterium]